jgi:hypothetical protein
VPSTLSHLALSRVPTWYCQFCGTEKRGRGQLGAPGVGKDRAMSLFHASGHSGGGHEEEVEKLPFTSV